MTKKPRRPTDAAIIKAHKQFEHGFNVADTLLRDYPQPDYPDLQHVGRDRDILFAAHRVMTRLAQNAVKRSQTGETS